MSSVSLTGIEIRDIEVDNLVTVSKGSLVKRVGKTKSATRRKEVKFKEIMFTQAKLQDVLKLNVYHSTINFLFGNDQFLGGATVHLNEIVKNETKRFELPLERAERGKISFSIKSYNFGIDHEEEIEGEIDTEKTGEVSEKDGDSNRRSEESENEEMASSSLEAAKEKDMSVSTNDDSQSSTIFQIVDSEVFSQNTEQNFLSAESFKSRMNNEEEDDDEKESRYQIIRRVGGGGMGTVFLAVDKSRKTDHHVAIKKVYLKSTKKLNQSMQEIWPTRKLEHPNLCVVQDMFFTGSDSSSNQDFGEKPGHPFVLNLVMKYFELGDLNAYIKRIRKSSKLFEKDVIISYITQLTTGLRYIHENDLLHRDIKPENVFLNEDYKVVKIGDFGLAKKFSTKSLASTSCGTPLYMAPEVLSSRRYNDKADVWSLGCLFYKLCTLNLKKVFNMEVYSNPNFYKEIHEVVVNSNKYPKWFAEVICVMLDKDGHKRPSAKQLAEILSEKSTNVMKTSEISENVSGEEESVEEEDFDLVNWLDLLKKNEWNRLKKCLIFTKEIKRVDELVDFENEEISMTPLIYSQKKEQYDVMEILLEKGSADPNEADTDGYTPLIRAVMWDQTDAIKLLLKYGAEQKMRSREGLTTKNYIEKFEKIHLLELFD